MVISQVCQCLILAFELWSTWQHIFIWINQKSTKSEQVACNTIVSFYKASLMCLGRCKSRHSCQSGALEFFMLSKVHFSPKQKLIWSHEQGKESKARADHPVDPTWLLLDSAPCSPYLLSLLFMYSWNQVLNSPSWCWARLTTCEAASRSPQRMQ